MSKLVSSDMGQKVIDWKNIQKILHMMVKANNCIVSSIMFVCSTHSRIFHSYGDVILTGEGLQILTYTRLSVKVGKPFTGTMKFGPE